jgi:hypothetical protein
MAADQVRIVHMASLARSGETLMLRTFTGHPAVRVVHDLLPTNDRHEHRLFQLLRVWPEATLPRRELERHLAPGFVSPSQHVLFIKQGVFSMRSPFAGFALVRNPYSSFCSLWSYDLRLAGRAADNETNRLNWQRLRLPRLVAWVDAMVPELLPSLLAEPDPARQWLMFWKARMAQLRRQCSTLLRYEDFVADPRRTLEAACAAAGLPFDAAMLQAHQRFRPGAIGHGGIDLGKPIRPEPPWKIDPLVDVGPFREAMADSPLPAYHAFYDRPPAPCAAPRRAAAHCA